MYIVECSIEEVVIGWSRESAVRYEVPMELRNQVLIMEANMDLWGVPECWSCVVSLAESGFFLKEQLKQDSVLDWEMFWRLAYLSKRCACVLSRGAYKRMRKRMVSNDSEG